MYIEYKSNVRNIFCEKTVCLFCSSYILPIQYILQLEFMNYYKILIGKRLIRIEHLNIHIYKCILPCNKGQIKFFYKPPFQSPHQMREAVVLSKGCIIEDFLVSLYLVIRDTEVKPLNKTLCTDLCVQPRTSCKLNWCSRSSKI